jgi:hypothetical protein
MPVGRVETLTATQQTWLNHIRRCEARGQTLAAYAKAEGIDLKTLYNWRYRLKKKGVLEAGAPRSARSTPAFHRVVVAREAFGHSEIRLRWPNGRVLEFDSGVDPRYVRGLIEGLEGVV